MDNTDSTDISGITDTPSKYICLMSDNKTPLRWTDNNTGSIAGIKHAMFLYWQKKNLHQHMLKHRATRFKGKLAVSSIEQAYFILGLIDDPRSGEKRPNRVHRKKPSRAPVFLISARAGVGRGIPLTRSTCRPPSGLRSLLDRYSTVTRPLPRHSQLSGALRISPSDPQRFPAIPSVP